MKKHKWIVFEDRYGKQVHMGLFDYTVIIMLYKDKEKILEFVRWKMECQSITHEAEALGITFYREGYVPIIWLPKRPSTAGEWATFAHEAVHATMHLFDWAGMSHIHATDEVFAHAVKRIVSSL